MSRMGSVLRLYRDDGTNQYGRVIAFLGAVTGDGVLDINFPRR